MQKLITDDEARQITGGSTPLVPVEYERAVKDLIACSTLDEAKYWDNKADALAAWAKIYRSDEAGLESRRLKLHAYRRIGELAAEIQPRKTSGVKHGTGRGGGGSISRSAPGPRAKLLEEGFTKKQADIIRKIALTPKPKFEEILDSPRPPTPAGMAASLRRGSESYKRTRMPGGIFAFQSFCRANNPKTLAVGIMADEARVLRKSLVEVSEWIDAFEQRLPENGEAK